MSINRDLINEIMECWLPQLNTNEGGGTILHHTITETDIPLEVMEILQKRGANFSAVSDCGLSVLSVGITNDRSNDCLKNLIKFGADPKAADSEGNTPLHLAVEKGNLELATFLVSEGVDVNTLNKKGDAPLHKVFEAVEAKTNKGTLAKLLLSNGANIQAKGSLGHTPATLMVHNSSEVTFELMQVLKEHGVDFNCEYDDGNGCSLLYVAVSSERCMDFIRNLVELGADPNVANRNGRTPLFIAVVMGYVEAAEFLISVGCDVNTTDNHGFTPLHFVLQTSASTAPMTKLLLGKGANVNAKDYLTGSTTVSLAGQHATGPSDFVEVLEILKENGADFNIVSIDGFSPLSFAIAKGRSTTLLQKLVDLGASLEFVHKHEKLHNSTLLHMAASALNIGAVDWLLSLGADINKIDNLGGNALKLAVAVLLSDGDVDQGKLFEMVRLLLERGSSLNTTKDGTPRVTALHLAAAANNLEMVKLLISEGGDVNGLDSTYLGTPLHALIIAPPRNSSVFEIAKLLLAYGSDPNIRNGKGCTVLDDAMRLAVCHVEQKTIELLISSGARNANANN